MEQLWLYLNTPDVLNKYANNRFFLIFFVIVLSSVKRSAYQSLWLAMLINLPGTALHECAHFIVGLFFNAKPVRFSIFPQKKEDRYVMGQVGFSNLKFYNALPSAMAPLSLLLLAYLLNLHFFEIFPFNFASYIAYLFLMTVLIENAMPSKMDFVQGFRFISGVLLYAVIILAGIIVF